MPRYTYRCVSCEFVFDVTHSMSIELEEYHCEQCEQDREVSKVPSAFYSFSQKGSTGKVVKSFISEAKEKLKEQRGEALEGKYVGTNNTSDS
jgi:putative FmdB family regulatory protein